MTFSCALLKRVDNKCEKDELSKTTNGQNIQNSSVSFMEDAFSLRTDTKGRVQSFDIRSSALYDLYRTNICYENLAYQLLAYELLHTIFCPHTIFFLRSFAYGFLVYDIFFTNSCLRSFGMQCFARYDHFLTNIYLRTFVIRCFSLRASACDLLSYYLLPDTIICLGTFAYELNPRQCRDGWCNPHEFF